MLHERRTAAFSFCAVSQFLLLDSEGGYRFGSEQMSYKKCENRGTWNDLSYKKSENRGTGTFCPTKKVKIVERGTKWFYKYGFVRSN